MKLAKDRLMVLSLPLKAFLTVAGGILFVGGGAYYTGMLDRFVGAPSATLASLPSGASSTNPADLKAGRLEDPAAPAAGSQPAGAGPTSTTQPAGAAPADKAVVPPAFQLVRVESDGSMVIAGTAAPNAKIEILAGSTVVGTAKAGPDGDFAAVLDSPMKPGDYQIVLRAEGEDGVVAMSPETAVVSVPDRPDGQVLALVEQPGQPSKMITVPEGAPANQNASASNSANAEDTPAPAAGSAAVPANEGQGVAPANSTASGTQPAPAPAAGAVSQQPATAGAMAPATGTAAATAPATTTAPAPANAAPVVIAKADPKPAAPTSVSDAQVRVDAVEIEGRTVYIAGTASPGRTVRVYANEILLGETIVGDAGNFLIESIQDLLVGDYIIRADLLATNGRDVEKRAAVPFIREPGEAIAAIASPPASDVPAKAPQAGAVQAPAQAQASAQAPAQASNAASAPTPTPAQDVSPAVAGSPTQTATGTSSTEVPASAQASTATPAPVPAPAQSQAQGQTQAQAQAQGQGSTANASSPPPASATASGTSTTAVPPTQPAPSIAAASQPSTAAQSAVVAPPTVTAEALRPVDGSVIIRRGDSLWRISRRVYGRGVRYSTIYLANQEQIRDPDRIWPGQVFTVPTKTDSGEVADMNAVAGQVSSEPAKPQP